MAFTVVGPDRFLASGHPDMREDKPVHLGLVESTDAAETWTALPLEGEADFHLLEPAGTRLYGYHSRSGSLLVTEDRQAWRTVLTGGLVDAGLLVGISPDGAVHRSGDGDVRWELPYAS